MPSKKKPAKKRSIIPKDGTNYWDSRNPRMSRANKALNAARSARGGRRKK